VIRMELPERLEELQAYLHGLAEERQELWRRQSHDGSDEVASRLRVITNTLNGHCADMHGGVGWINDFLSGGLYEDKRRLKTLIKFRLKKEPDQATRNRLRREARLAEKTFG
jgi:hypothetical protein